MQNGMLLYHGFEKGGGYMQKRTVVVTGASKGIGKATSQRLAHAGYHVIGIARTEP